MTDRELIQMALDALETVTAKMLDCRDELAEYGGRPKSTGYKQRLWDSSYDVYVDNAIPAAEALRERLAQGEKNEFNPDWDAMAVMVEEQQRMAKRIKELEAAQAVLQRFWRQHQAQGEQENMNEPRNGWQLREVWFEDGEPTMHREPSKPEPVAWGLEKHIVAGGIGTTPVAFKRHEEFGFIVPLYTAPPQRPWQGLTDEGIEAMEICLSQGIADGLARFARAIEAKLKEKNHGR